MCLEVMMRPLLAEAGASTVLWRSKTFEPSASLWPPSPTFSSGQPFLTSLNRRRNRDSTKLWIVSAHTIISFSHSLSPSLYVCVYLTTIQPIELYSRRRWTIRSAQQSNTHGICHVACVDFYGFVINTTAYHLGQNSLHLHLLKSSMTKLLAPPSPSYSLTQTQTIFSLTLCTSSSLSIYLSIYLSISDYLGHFMQKNSTEFTLKQLDNFISRMELLCARCISLHDNFIFTEMSSTLKPI